MYNGRGSGRTTRLLFRLIGSEANYKILISPTKHIASLNYEKCRSILTNCNLEYKCNNKDLTITYYGYKIEFRSSQYDERLDRGRNIKAVIYDDHEY